MDEKTVKQVIMKYLSKQGIRFSPKKEKAAGPDILIDGTALEIKGKTFNIKSALEQFIKYALEYTDLQIGFPIETLSIEFIYSLYALEWAVKYRPPSGPHLIKTYLVCKSNGEEYCVERFESIEALLEDVKEKIGQKAYLAVKSDEALMKNALEIGSNINKVIKKLLEKEVISFGHKVLLENK